MGEKTSGWDWSIYVHTSYLLQLHHFHDSLIWIQIKAFDASRMAAMEGRKLLVITTNHRERERCNSSEERNEGTKDSKPNEFTDHASSVVCVIIISSSSLSRSVVVVVVSTRIRIHCRCCCCRLGCFEWILGGIAVELSPSSSSLAGGDLQALGGGVSKKGTYLWIIFLLAI